MQFKFKVAFALAFATLAAAGASDNKPGPAGSGKSTDPGKSTGQGTKVAPPFPSKGTIGGGQCSSGHLRCCKFHSQDRYSTR
jgi:hypothetical protein